jgi:hypothetical protein
LQGAAAPSRRTLQLNDRWKTPGSPNEPRQTGESIHRVSVAMAGASRRRLERNVFRVKHYVVIAGLVPAIHAFLGRIFKTWMPVTSTSMTIQANFILL